MSNLTDLILVMQPRWWHFFMRLLGYRPEDLHAFDLHHYCKCEDCW